MLDLIEQKIVDDVAKFGWHLLEVEECEEHPSFVYSIGLMDTFSHPELIVFGLSGDLMGRLVNIMGKEIRRGRSFREPGLYSEILAGYACKFMPVRTLFHTKYLGYALWHRRYIGKLGTLEAVQCIWPDRNGLFPDERGCDLQTILLQPLLQ